MSSKLSQTWSRMKRTIRLNPTVFKEIKTDPAGLEDGLNVILLVFFLTSIYILVVERVSWEFSRMPGMQFVVTVISLLTDPIIIVAEWITLSCGVFFFTRIFKGYSSLRSTLACLAYSKTPYILSVLRAIPVLGLPLGILPVAWSIICEIIAIRESSDISTVKAILMYVSLILLLFFITSLIAKFSPFDMHTSDVSLLK